MCGPLVVLPRLFLTGVEGNFDPRICHQGSSKVQGRVGGGGLLAVDLEE